MEDSDTSDDQDGSPHLLSSSFDGHSEDELRILAEALAPKITSLFQYQECELENLLSGEKQAWNDEEEKFIKHMTLDGKTKKFVSISMSKDDDTDGDYEDGMQAELELLSNAEQTLRDELYNFEYLMRSSDNNLMDENDTDNPENRDASSHDNEEERDNYTTTKLSEVSQLDSSQNRNDHQEDDIKPRNIIDDFDHLSVQERGTYPGNSKLESSLKKTEEETKPYSLCGHAKAIGLQFQNIDLGYPTCPILGRKNAEILIDTPSDYFDSVDTETCSHSSTSNIDVIVGQDLSCAVDEENNVKLREEAIHEILQCTREYVIPLSGFVLNKIYAGLHGINKGPKPKSIRRKEEKFDSFSVGSASEENDETSSVIEIQDDIIEKLPVRTVIIRIRPDILCGAVMDAVQTAVKSLNGEIMKRQGGHFRAILPGGYVIGNTFEPNEQDKIGLGLANIFSPQKVVYNSPTILPPFIIDAQLCTRRKSRECERVLLVRSFRMEVDEVIDDHFYSTDNRNNVDIDYLDESTSNIRESAALFQRLRSMSSLGSVVGFGKSLQKGAGSEYLNKTRRKKPSVQKLENILASPFKMINNILHDDETYTVIDSQRDGIEWSDSSHDNISKQKVPGRLMNMSPSTPSVKDKNDDAVPIPALSVDDLPFVQSSWIFVKECLDELDNRDLVYSSLVSSPFGAFPSLPTLDVHYCSQMKEMCRDNMVISLVKSARELEHFAREAEFLCAKLIQVLRPTYVTYQGLEPPSLPTALPLTSYPLDYQPSEISFPPWGLKVMEALNQVSSQTQSRVSPANERVVFDLPSTDQSTVDEKLIFSSGKKMIPKTEFSKAREGVHLVLSAFQKQEDEEMTARLSRKNVQVLDRLSRMEAHKRESIISIRDSYESNVRSTQAADKFHTNAMKISGVDELKRNKKGPFYSASDQVPLLACRIFISGKNLPGMCFITSYQILIMTTQIIPILGGNHMELFNLKDIECDVNRPTRSLLNPLPPSISLYSHGDRKELISFRPSIGANIFKDFLSIVKTIIEEDPNEIKFSSTGGILYMLEDKRSLQEEVEASINAISALTSSTSS